MCEVSWGEFQDILGEGQDENRPFLVFTANDLKKYCEHILMQWATSNHGLRY